MTRRRRYVACLVSRLVSPSHRPLARAYTQPYLDQAAKDKERAEREKKDYDVSLSLAPAPTST